MSLFNYLDMESEKFSRIFPKQNNVVIGAIHLPPLPGYKGFPGFDEAIRNAIADLEALELGGADAAIFENNYDLPHRISVGPETISAMTIIGAALRQHTKLPLGISVLWNDYQSALAIANAIDLQFIRIPVYVDKVETSYGVAHGDPFAVLAYREKIAAEDIALFVDIHVKHSKILSRHSIEESAEMAITNGADALIVTGNWTGDPADLQELKAVRNTVGDFPILCGSGVDADNIKTQFEYANGAIVSTSLKEDSPVEHEVNIKGYDARISSEKTALLVQSI